MLKQVKYSKRVVEGYVIGDDMEYFGRIYPDIETAEKALKKMRTKKYRVLAKIKRESSIRQAVELSEVEGN